MIEPREFFDPIVEVEALVRGARGYVQPSENLRPQVMETVRTERVERVVQVRIWQAAILFSLLGILASAALERVQLNDAYAPPTAANCDRSPSPSAAGSGPWDGVNWDAVDSFRELRRRQALMLRLHL